MNIPLLFFSSEGAADTRYDSCCILLPDGEGQDGSDERSGAETMWCAEREDCQRLLLN